MEAGTGAAATFAGGSLLCKNKAQSVSLLQSPSLFEFNGPSPTDGVHIKPWLFLSIVPPQLG